MQKFDVVFFANCSILSIYFGDFTASHVSGGFAPSPDFFQVTVQMLAIQQHLPLHCISQGESGQMLRQFLKSIGPLVQEKMGFNGI
jgi:hypothetical protein